MTRPRSAAGTTLPRVPRLPVAVGLAMLSGTLGTILTAGPAHAHGAPTNPVSRAASCGTEGGERAQSAACRAARAASGGQMSAEWDNLRLPDVNGRDREAVPDGKLCSAGLGQFRGLDLVRRDWPATKLSAGAGHTFTYRGTIPHKGTFRLYVTKNGYDPARRLKWSDLQSQPFLTATDPKFKGGSYVFRGRLPQGKTGRHLIYTIWQNSSTPDTYYSCSDVVFGGGVAGGNGTDGSAAGAPKSAGGSGGSGGSSGGDKGADDGSAANGAGDDPAGASGGSPAGVSAAEPPGSGGAGRTTDTGTSQAVSADGDSGMLPLAAGAAGMLLLLGLGFAFLRRRRV